jgi:hypothetical protein
MYFSYLLRLLPVNPFGEQDKLSERGFDTFILLGQAQINMLAHLHYCMTSI